MYCLAGFLKQTLHKGFRKPANIEMREHGNPDLPKTQRSSIRGGFIILMHVAQFDQ